MAYNGSGTFSVLSTFTSNTTISSSAMNALLADVASGLTTAVTKDGQTTCTGPIKLAVGSVSAPGLAFGSDTDCGLYRIGADNIGFAIGGSKVLDISSTGIADSAGSAFAAFAVGTAMLFAQTSAPTGWTKSTTHNDKTLRVVSGTASSGGSAAFSTVFGITATNSYTLTTTDIPSHTHTGTTEGESATHIHTGVTEIENSAHNHAVNYDRPNASTVVSPAGATAVFTASFGSGSASVGTESGTHTHNFGTGANTSGHTHTFTTAATGSSGGHTHAIDLRVNYVDVIIATKA